MAAQPRQAPREWERAAWPGGRPEVRGGGGAVGRAPGGPLNVSEVRLPSSRMLGVSGLGPAGSCLVLVKRAVG